MQHLHTGKQSAHHLTLSKNGAETSLEKSLQPRGLGIVATDDGTQHIRVVSVDRGSIAQRIGLRAGDVIEKVNGRNLSGHALVSAMARNLNGTFNITVSHTDRGIQDRRDLQVTGYKPLATFGAKVTSTSIGEIDSLHIKGGSIPQVSEITEGSNAARLGLKSGDFIVSVKRSGVKGELFFNGTVDPSEFVAFKKSLRPGEKVEMTILRYENGGLKSHHLKPQMMKGRDRIPEYQDFSF